MGYDDPWDQAIEASQGPLEPLAPNVWWVWSVMASPPLPRNMIVVRLADGGLVLHSPICLPEPKMAELDALGPVKVLIVPNAGHRMDAKRYRKRYPSAKLVAPRAAVKAVEEVVPVDASAEDLLPDHGIRWHAPDGMSPGYELVYEVPLEGGGRALVVNDVLVGPHPASVAGVKGVFMRMLGSPGGAFGQARIVRFMFGKDAAAFRGFVEKLAAIPEVRLLTSSHGGPVRGDVAGTLREALTRL